MVIDVPTADDFRAFGLRYLNLGWGAARHIAIEIADRRAYDSDEALRQPRFNFAKSLSTSVPCKPASKQT